MLKRSIDSIGALFLTHKNERKGFFVVLTMLMTMACWLFYEYKVRDTVLEPSILVQQKMVELKQQQAQYKASRKKHEQVSYFDFAPNSLKKEGWERLGFSSRQAASIIKYRNTGVTFRIKRDLAKLFVVSDAKYKELEPYIQLPDKLEHKKPYAGRKEQEREVVAEKELARNLLELNGANALQLESLPYIGAKTATQIIRFRDLLGGFHSKEQLAEVYYLRDKPEAVKELMRLVMVIPDKVKRIPVNECEPAALADHPFLSWKEANALVNYRNHHGAFKKMSDLQGCRLITDDLFRKIAPYLTIE